MDTESIVYVVDEDPSIRDAVRAIAETLGLGCKQYSSGLRFLEEYNRTRPGCLVTELRMMAISGLQIQRRLLLDGGLIPVVFMAAQADIPTIVRAMRDGAVHFLEKPFRDQELWDAIQEAVELSRERVRKQVWRSKAASQIAGLTPKERQVLELIGQDKAKKTIASELGVCVRTIEIHRAKLMTKLEVETVPALKRVAEVASEEPAWS